MDAGAGPQAAGTPLDPQHAGLIAVAANHQRLGVEHDIRHVFHHAGQIRELVLRAVQFELRDRGPLQAR